MIWIWLCKSRKMRRNHDENSRISTDTAGIWIAEISLKREWQENRKSFRFFANGFFLVWRNILFRFVSISKHSHHRFDITSLDKFWRLFEHNLLEQILCSVPYIHFKEMIHWQRPSIWTLNVMNFRNLIHFPNVFFRLLWINGKENKRNWNSVD